MLNLKNVLFFVGFFLIGGSQATISRSIFIGVLYNGEYESLVNTLRYLINYEINAKFLPEAYLLKPIMVKATGNNLLSREIAAKLSTAVCIFDLYSNDPEAFALSDILKIPLITADNLRDDPPNKYVLSMRPHYSIISQALYDIAMYFRFDEVAVVYDVRMTRLASHFFAKARIEDRFNVRLIPELDLEDPQKTASSLQVLLTTYIKNVILICDQKDMAHIMNQVLHVGINEKGYKWISSDVEVAGQNKTYPSILGMVGLSLHLTNKEASKQLEMIASSVGGGKPLSPVVYAAMNDSLYVVSRAIRSFISAGIWPSIYPATSTETCPLKTTPGQVGDRLLAPLKTINHRGLTGFFSFDTNRKSRSKRILDIINIGKKDVEKVGSWKPNPKGDEDAITMKNVNPIKWVGDFAELTKCHNPGPTGKKFSRERKILRITAVIEPPFLEWSNGSIETRPVSNTSLQGFCLDILNELSRKTGFGYKILLRKDTSYGGRTPDGKYTGMLGDLINKKADLALAPITITSEREALIDFSKPFWDFSISLIMQKETDEKVELFAFVKPFDGVVWLLTIAVVLFVTVMMYAVDLFSPFGHRAEAKETGEGDGDEFNLFNSLWFATASMLQQGGDNTPKSPSGRILAASFWFFILIIISTYTANLAAFFTIKQSKRSINSLDDLVKQDKIKYGVLSSGAMKSFFESSQVALYRQMFSQMRQQNSFVSSTKEGVARARAGGYAYLTEQPYLDYYNQRKPCNTMLLNNLLTAKSYGFGLQRNSPYANELSVAILDLRENGFIEKTRAKWWDERSECTAKAEEGSGSTASLGIQNMAGVFIILLGGVAFSFLFIIIEIKCKRIVNMLTKNQDNNREVSRSQTVKPSENSRDEDSGQMPCLADEDEYDSGSREQLAEMELIVQKRPTHLNLPESYANTQESKI